MIIVRPANNTDCHKIFEWRNDFLARRMFRNSQVIKIQEHVRWFQKSLKDKNINLLICLDKNRKIASVRFDRNKLTAKVSINLCRAKRGKGMAKICLDKSINFYNKKFPKIKIIYAEIKFNNIASKKTFKNVGFKFMLKSGKFLQYCIDL
jgi:L-amino acid N-acyltransferase YncA